MISPHPTTGATINYNEFASFLEGILRASQIESTCDDCADVTDGSPVVNIGGGATKPAVDDPASESGGYGLQPIRSPQSLRLNQERNPASPHGSHVLAIFRVGAQKILLDHAFDRNKPEHAEG